MELYILNDDSGNKEVRTRYYENRVIYTTYTYFKYSKLALKELRTFSYKAIESIYSI